MCLDRYRFHLGLKGNQRKAELASIGPSHFDTPKNQSTLKVRSRKGDVPGCPVNKVKQVELRKAFGPERVDPHRNPMEDP